MKRLIAAATALLLSLTSLSLPANAQSLIDGISERGKLRVGMSSFTPWAMRSKDGGFIGFEVDVAQQLADDMGVELEIVPTNWDGIIPALLAKKFDVIIGGLSITPQRNLKINFTIPYANSGMDLVANKEIAPNHSDVADFNRDGYIIAIRRGTTALEVIRKQMPKVEIRQFDDERTALQETINGNAHGFASATPVPSFAVFDNPEKLYLPFEDLLHSNMEGFGLRKSDPDALNFFDNWIAIQTANGWLHERHEYWFGGKEWQGLVADG